MMKLFKNMTARTKIVTAFAAIFIVGFLINFAVTSAQQRAEAIHAVVVEAQELTLALEKVRTGMGEMFTGGFYDMDVLLKDPDKLFLAVPVVRSLLVGTELAAESNYSFKAPAFDA